MQQYIDAGRLLLRSSSPAVRSMGSALQPGLQSLQKSLSELLGDVGLSEIRGTGAGPAARAHLIFAAAPGALSITGLPVLGSADAAADTELFRLLEAGQALVVLAGLAILALGFLVAEERRETLKRFARKLEADARRQQAQLKLQNQKLARTLHANARATDAALEDCQKNNDKKQKCLEQVVKGSTLLLGEAFKQAVSAAEK